MARAFTPKVVTANALLEGDVIYMKPNGEWSRLHSEAKLFEDETEANDALAHASEQASLLVGAYLADAVKRKDGKPEPVHFREVFRTKGPSNYPDHGKQAEL
ncbi:MAG: DUF2849 domain-containing protein [Rhizobiaceae bacterium]|nr:DUF2849 domain-containing protein [Rhizobiaceae bacterium]